MKFKSRVKQHTHFGVVQPKAVRCIEVMLMQDQANGDASEDTPLGPRFSGKVSGILDDLSDAMSMLKDLLPSANSELHIQASLTVTMHL